VTDLSKIPDTAAGRAYKRIIKDDGYQYGWDAVGQSWGWFEKAWDIHSKAFYPLFEKWTEEVEELQHQLDSAGDKMAPAEQTKLEIAISTLQHCIANLAEANDAVDREPPRKPVCRIDFDDNSNLDDVAIGPVDLFRLEYMDEGEVWIRCYRKHDLDVIINLSADGTIHGTYEYD
jgi:hypothetical protein